MTKSTGKRPYLPQGFNAEQRLARRSVIVEGGCRLWKGALTVGYGRIMDDDGKIVLVHRLAYRLAHGDIPLGAEIDHACHDPATCKLTDTCPHRGCVEPAHLRAVTGPQNKARSNGLAQVHAAQTHCSRNHPFAGPGSDVYIHPGSGWRTCRHCARIWDAARSRRKKAAL